MSGTVIPRSILALVAVIAVMTAAAAAAPFIVGGGPGPSEHISVRGESVELFGYGLYQHMPADVAVQGLAQDLVTLAIAVPLLLLSLAMARRRSDVGYFLLTGTVGYLFVQYTLYLAMAMYNALFMVWVAIVLLLFQVLVRLLLLGADRDRMWPSPTRATRRYVGGFLIANAALIGLLWLSLIVPPILDGTLYPPGLAHFTTMIVQGFDLALFLPPSLLAGYYYLRGRKAGDLMAPAYSVFLSIQMVALLAKIAWMTATGASAGPALIIIPLLLIGAVTAAYLSLKPNARAAAAQ